MADKNDTPGKSTSGEPTAAKRPHSVIDLKATEVKTAAVGQGAAKPAESPSGPAAKADALRPGSDRADAAKPSEKPAAGVRQPGPGAAAPAANNATRASVDGPITAASNGGRSAGMLSHAAAALIGGLLAVFASGPIAELIGSDTGNRALEIAQNERDLRARLGRLEDAVGAGRTSAAGADLIGKVDSRLAKLDELANAVRGLSEAQSKLAADSQAVAQKLNAPGGAGELAQRLTKLEDTLSATSALTAEAAKTGRPINLAPVFGRMADLEASVESKLGAARKGVAQDIDARIKPAEEQVETVKSTAQRLDREMAQIKTDQQRLSQALEQARQQVARAEASADAGQKAAGSLKVGLDQLKGDVETRVATAANAAVAPMVGKVAAIETNLDSVVKRDEDRQANARRTLLALELANLRKAIDAGRPFGKELADIKQLGAGMLDLKPLDSLASERLVTSAELLREFRSASNAVLDADAGRRTDGSLAGEIMARARSIVRVRKVSAEAKGDDAEAVLARMEAALKDGDLDRVQDEAGKLPEPAAAAARPWLQKLEARRSVDRALKAIEDKLKSTLSGANAPSPAAPAKSAPSKG